MPVLPRRSINGTDRNVCPTGIAYHPASLLPGCDTFAIFMSDQQRLLIIINNVAAKARRAWPVVRAKLEKSGVPFDFYETTGAGDAIRRTRLGLEEGNRTIAVVGGDGTLSEAAEGFFEFSEAQSESLPVPINPEAALAILPAGTGDDFARGLLGRRAPLEEWIDILLAQCQRTARQNMRVIDVMFGTCDGYAKSFLCLNASTLGIGGETASRVAAQGSLMRQLGGEARFAAAAVGALAAWRERVVRVTVDETVVEGPMNLVAVANGLYAGGGMKLSPQARIDDGLLDVVTASGFNRAHVLRELPRIHRGGHVANPKVRVTQGRRVRIETFADEDALLIEADGNVRGQTPAEFRIMPRALRFVVANEGEG